MVRETRLGLEAGKKAAAEDQLKVSADLRKRLEARRQNQTLRAWAGLPDLAGGAPPESGHQASQARFQNLTQALNHSLDWLISLKG